MEDGAENTEKQQLLFERGDTMSLTVATYGYKTMES